jgi:hypothetical protein
MVAKIKSYYRSLNHYTQNINLFRLALIALAILAAYRTLSFINFKHEQQGVSDLIVTQNEQNIALPIVDFVESEFTGQQVIDQRSELLQEFTGIIVEDYNKKSSRLFSAINPSEKWQSQLTTKNIDSYFYASKISLINPFIYFAPYSIDKNKFVLSNIFKYNKLEYNLALKKATLHVTISSETLSKFPLSNMSLGFFACNPLEFKFNVLPSLRWNQKM